MTTTFNIKEVYAIENFADVQHKRKIFFTPDGKKRLCSTFTFYIMWDRPDGYNYIGYIVRGTEVYGVSQKRGSNYEITDTYEWLSYDRKNNVIIIGDQK